MGGGGDEKQIHRRPELYRQVKHTDNKRCLATNITVVFRTSAGVRSNGVARVGLKTTTPRPAPAVGGGGGHQR
jgi:hypothetical protein